MPNLTNLKTGKIYTSIGAALLDINEQSEPGLSHEFALEPGVYREKIDIVSARLRLLGPALGADGVPQARIVWDDAAGKMAPDGSLLGTFRTQTLAVLASDFRAERLIIANDWDYPADDALPVGHAKKLTGSQAVALKIDGMADRSSFIDCFFEGFQDTLYLNAGRSYFKNCKIFGTVDFIFGAGQAVFDNCELVCLGRPQRYSDDAYIGFVCAPSTRAPARAGFVFDTCSIVRGNPAPPDASYALGRPWHPSFAPDTINAALFVACFFDSHIAPKAWTSMVSRPGGVPTTYQPEDALFFECDCKGPGSRPERHNLEREDARALRNACLGDWVILE